MSRPILQMLANELAALLEPVVLAMESEEAMQGLLGRLGVYDIDAAGPAAVFGTLLELKAELESLASQDEVSFETVEVALQASRSAFELGGAVSDIGSPSGELEGIGRDLVDLLLSLWIARRHPVAREVCALLTLLELAEDRPQRPVLVDGDIVLRIPPRLDRIRLDRLPDLLRDPVAVLKAEYVNALATEADAEAMAERLFPRLGTLLLKLGVSCRYGFKPGDEEFLGDAAPLMRHALIVYAVDPLLNGEAEAGVVLTLSPASSGDLGLVVSPFGALNFTKRFERWQFESGLTAEVDVVAWGHHGLTLLAAAEDVDLGANIIATTVQQQEGPAYVFGASDGTRIEIGSMRLAAETALSLARQTLSCSVDMPGCALVIAPGDNDGFLSSVLPPQGMRTDFDLGLAWSSERGLTFKGSGSLDTTLPVNVSYAGVRLSGVHLRIAPEQGRVLAQVSATLSASIGPVRATVDRVGFAAALDFPETGGNLGVANLDLGLKSPDGIGLSVDAGGVLTGGGFLFHDRAQALYGGAMQLSLYERITLKAFGLIATRMPDGSKGYSLTVFMTAEDFKPIQIGMGFALLGIGGMIGIHRRFDEAAMRENMGNGTLGNLLFPRDPVRNAPEIIRSLATIFPAQRGSYLLGVLAKIGWSMPPLVTMDLALIYQFGLHRRLIALGRIQSLLPTRDNALIQLNLDAFGVIDFDDGSVEIDAVLVDSRLAHRFVMTGDMALRARWSGPGSGFVLAVGGLNRNFTSPVPLPNMKRMAIALSAGNNPRLTCEAYFAITANTLQFGARAQLYAAAIGFSVEGEVGFDVLVQWVPFHFMADFRASLQLKRGSRNLFKVSVSGALEGPRPLRISGKASFEILWCDFTVRFDKTLVDGQHPPLPPAVNVLDELTRALADIRNWTTQHNAQQQHGVALRKLPATSPGLVLDPLGALTVKQQVVPLNTLRDIELFGGAPVAGARRFVLAATLGGSHAADVQGAVQDLFAPAQFFPMSDAEKLASPSFEEMQAGMRFGSDDIAFDDDAIVASPLQFETIVIDAAGASSRPKVARYTLSTKRLDAQMLDASVAKAPLRGSGQARFREVAATQAASLRAPRWVATSIADTSVQAPGVRSEATWSEQRAAVVRLNQDGEVWQLMLEQER